LTRTPLLSSAAVAESIRGAAALLALAVGFALLYAYLQFVLSLFPWTRGIADLMVSSATGIVTDLLSGLFGYLPDLFSIVVIVFIARLLLRGLRGMFDQVGSGRIALGSFYPEWAAPTYSLVRFLVIAVAAVMVFPYLPGSGSEGFKGISVFLGLLVSLGAASAIANVIAGIVITYMRPFRVGERVKIADAVGDVIGKDLFVVRLRTVKNVDITIPNSLVLANHIVNFSSSAATRGLVLHTKVTIGYDVPWRKVHELMIGAARRVEGILESPPPYVLQTSLDDFSVSYELNACTDRPSEMATLYSRLHGEVLDAFNAAGVEIMSPAYTAVRDGNRATIPDEHLPKDYRPPAFNVFSRILRPQQEG
jgi:small-conductance mechanosensitive channel